MSDAPEQILLRLRGFIDQTMSRMRVRPHERDDCRQEILIRLWKRAHEYDASRGTVTTWAYWIIRSAINNHMRQNALFGPHNDRTRPRERVGFMDHRHATEDPAIASFDFHRAGPWLVLALSRLPEVEQRILALRSEGVTLEEIGSELGVTREAIRQREEKAIAKLRLYVRQQEYGARARAVLAPCANPR